MDTDNLQQTLTSLMQSGSNSNPAYATLLRDYTTYHAVLLIEGGLFALLLIVLSTYLWWRFTRIQGSGAHTWAFAKKAYFGFGLLSTAVALFMLLIVAANLSNVLNPQAGFAQSIPDLGTPQAGTHRAALHAAVNGWVQSGNAGMPALVQESVRARLAWQLPKAIVCTLLFVVFAVFSTRLWRRLIQLRAHAGVWNLRDKALLAIGVFVVPATCLLMIMALANTQATFAPLTLTLLFG